MPGLHSSFHHTPLSLTVSPPASHRHYRKMPPKISAFGVYYFCKEAFTYIYNIYIYIFPRRRAEAMYAGTKGKVVEQFPQLLPFPRKRPLSSVDVDVRRFWSCLVSFHFHPFLFLSLYYSSIRCRWDPRHPRWILCADVGKKHANNCDGSSRWLPVANCPRINPLDWRPWFHCARLL